MANPECVCATWAAESEADAAERGLFGGHRKECPVELVVGEGLGLFQVDEGIDHWVIAKSAEDALAVVKETDGVSDGDRGWTDESPHVTRLTIAHASLLRFVGDTLGDDPVSMREEALRDPVRRYVACSEY